MFNYYEQLLDVIIAFQKINPLEHKKSFKLIYRDFKMENLIIGENKVLKVIDFGHIKLAN